MSMKRFRLYHGNEVSCFGLKSVKQIKAIAKEYSNVKKIVEVKRNPLTGVEKYVIITV